MTSFGKFVVITGEGDYASYFPISSATLCHHCDYNLYASSCIFKLNSGQVTAALSFCKATFLASFRILEKNRKIMPPKSNNQKKKEAEAAGKAPKKTKQQENAGGLIP